MATLPCTRASLGVTTAPAITIVVTVDAAQTANLSLTAALPTSTADAVPGNNSDTETTQVNTSADLEIVKTAEPHPSQPDTNLDYILPLLHHNHSVASSVSVSDPLPSGTTLVSATGTG